MCLLPQSLSQMKREGGKGEVSENVSKCGKGEGAGRDGGREGGREPASKVTLFPKVQLSEKLGNLTCPDN